MPTNQIIRMRCGSAHPRLFALPEGARVDWSGVASWIESGRFADSPGSQRKPILLRCAEPGCKRAMRAYLVKGRHSDKITCGPRCLAAIGPDCECSCNGENHGAN
jgi:hypothetical protein